MLPKIARAIACRTYTECRGKVRSLALEERAGILLHNANQDVLVTKVVTPSNKVTGTYVLPSVRVAPKTSRYTQLRLAATAGLAGSPHVIYMSGEHFDQRNELEPKPAMQANHVAKLFSSLKAGEKTPTRPGFAWASRECTEVILSPMTQRILHNFWQRQKEENVTIAISDAHHPAAPNTDDNAYQSGAAAGDIKPASVGVPDDSDDDND